MFFKKDYKLKFRKFHKETPVLESLFNKVSAFMPAMLLKRLQRKCFPVKNAKYLGHPFL